MEFHQGHATSIEVPETMRQRVTARKLNLLGDSKVQHGSVTDDGIPWYIIYLLGWSAILQLRN